MWFISKKIEDEYQEGKNEILDDPELSLIKKGLIILVFTVFFYGRLFLRVAIPLLVILGLATLLGVFK
jgi:hypothetical protein